MLQQIQHKLETLSPAEQRVGEWVLAHPRRAAHAAIGDVATAAGTSQPTVLRFCRHVGTSGFRELKIRLAESMSQPVSYVHQGVAATDSINDVVSKVIDHSIRSLYNIREFVAAMPFEAAVTRMRAARQLLFAGIGASGIVADDARHKFFRLGIPCSTARDLPTLLQAAAIAGPDDLLVCISQSGSATLMVDAARAARANKAQVIALTAPGSPLAAEADLLFELHAAEDVNVYTPMSSRLVQLAVLDALQVALALKLGTTAEEKLRATKAALAAGRTQLA